ncbi:hypothetical protein BDV37DRAFT_285434 [Aspergillus pseudonomiae]|uniref:JmjC domain-containing protein n=1 Tax=Aspergillus pseudonomiae TaxID=1506151 RepID=A0A5N7D5Q7_9EURO|nr:uncharacterized protein BDV37DRAFT_285434 [Aspergillus pseudonomiae]KAE8401735.1 hypothetical protein BDV37DRAFT_285434 [Aspergillus pseudonomiae]
MEFSQSSIPSVQDLLRSGGLFVPFSEFPVQAIYETPGWFEKKLQEGKPFVIRGLNQTDRWDASTLNNGCLVTSSSSGVRNCQTGRDVRMRLRDLIPTDHTRAGHARESLYAKDLQCPVEWIRALKAVLPSCLMQLGSFDLFRVLPKEITPEVLMAYVGTQLSLSGFHRCFSGTVALNLMIESEESRYGSLCFGTDQRSQEKYDAFMEGLGKSSHTDWANISIAQMESANFPIYVTHQEPGDLVIFPSATAHQIWNVSPMVTKVVWNILHASSIPSFFDYIQPVYQKQCYADTGRVPLIPIHALRDSSHNPEETKLLVDMLQQLVDDEDTGCDSSVPIKLVDTQGAVVECNFCGLTIWNRHLHCEQCGDFDLCLTCYVSGRSCKHVGDYTWAELFRSEYCRTLIKTTRDRLGGYSPSDTGRPKRKTLGAMALVAAEARRQSSERLCHLCRDSHPIWKGITCSQCSAFFCYRGLYRHFDIDLLKFLRNETSWDKPVRARIKPVDPRGRISGFVDNVFDQKRGKRAVSVTQSASPQNTLDPRGQKRHRLPNDDGHERSLHEAIHSSSESVEPAQNRRSDIVADADVPPGLPMRGSSTGSFNSKGQLRISDLVEDRSSPDKSFHHSRHVEAHIPLSSTPKNTPYRYPHEPNNHIANAPNPIDEENIPSLERKLGALRQYADGLLELSLIDSHAKVLDKISDIEARIERKRRQKAELLFSGLNRDFPDLADMAMEEARRRGI